MPNRAVRTVFAVLCLASVALAAPEQPYPLRDAVECTVRGGCPNFFGKLGAGASLKIAYLGGSITAEEALALDAAAFAERFNGTKWHTGHIMFIGELVE
ncbi:MAG: hypothetical protein JXR37_05245 [Kiritimatiellae bacterium]|nr:hypothetical protein [Kiritimatiellia bacterium]